MTKLCFKADPPNIVPWLSKKNVIFLHFDADVEDNGVVRLDLNIAFDPIVLTEKDSNGRYDYYIGNSGAEITVEIVDGQILESTPEAALDVSYTNSFSGKRKSELTISPDLKAKGKFAELGMSIGSFTRAAGEERSFSTGFSNRERYLAAVRVGNTLKWTIKLPRGEHIIRDYLFGNLYLFAKCSWNVDLRSGVIKIRPSDVMVFDPKNKPLGFKRTLLMWFFMCSKYVENCDGFLTEFTEIQS